MSKNKDIITFADAFVCSAFATYSALHSNPYTITMAIVFLILLIGMIDLQVRAK